jgi:ABC-2 type transport system ATP-binding protein
VSEQTKDTPAIELIGVTKRYGSLAALDDISLRVQQGHVHGFLGLNGAGKTTAIKILMNFIRPTKGSVRILGKDARSDSVELKRRIGYLSGDFELYNNLTGDQYLRYIAHLRGVKDYDHLKELCRELEVVLDRKIGTLSRGNKQKVGLVSALIDDPDLLILDEPTTGLDPLMQQKFYKVVRSHAARGKTVFMSSHILSEVQEVCDEITFMRRGKIVQTLNVTKLLASSVRHVVMIGEGKLPLLEPTKQLGAKNIKQTKTSLSFDVEAADRKILRWIATQPVKDVTITEANLDELFAALYKEEHV